jgi:hypothetical protein
MRRAVAACVVSVAIGLGGCAQPVHQTWTKPGATRQEIARDASDCDRAATFDPTHGQEQGYWGGGGTRRDARVFDSCMRSRGY